MFSRRRRLSVGSDASSIAVDEEEPEPFEEMYSVFRIVALYEMMMHGQWKYVMHYLENKKTELVYGMCIGSAFEIIRLMCVLIIGILLILLRVTTLLVIESNSIVGNITWIISMNSFSCWMAAMLCGLIVVQFSIYQCRNTTLVVASTTANFVFSIMMIACILPLVILKDNSEAFMKEAFHRGLLRDGDTEAFQTHQQRVKCCGIDGPLDYNRSPFMSYVNPLTNRTENVYITRSWAVSKAKFYSFPQSCCRKGNCAQRNLTIHETQEVLNYKNNQKWDLLLKYFMMPESGTYWKKGCLNEIESIIESYTMILISILAIFAVFTALTIGFVIILLLYHDGIGQIVSDQKMFGVERNTGVHFLMSLDMIDSDFQDDFSLIEFLRNSDIDKFMAGDKLRRTIDGRKEAEKA